MLNNIRTLTFIGESVKVVSEFAHAQNVNRCAARAREQVYGRGQLTSSNTFSAAHNIRLTLNGDYDLNLGGCDVTIIVVHVHGFLLLKKIALSVAIAKRPRLRVL